MDGLRLLALIIVAVMFVFGSVGLVYFLPTRGLSEWWQMGIAICGLWLGYIVIVYYVAND